MSVLHQAVKQFLSEVDKFLKCTLKNEKISSSAQKEKNKILECLENLYGDYAVLNPNLDTEKQNQKRLSSTISPSSSVEESEFPPTTVKSLVDATKTGYLLQKKCNDSSEKSKQKKYCVIQKNMMYWFKKPSDKSQQGAVCLTGCDFKDLTLKNKEFVFEVDCVHKMSVQFQADCREDLEEWKKAVEIGAKFVEAVIPKPKPKPKLIQQEEVDEATEAEYIYIEDVNDAVKKSSAARVTKLPSLESPPPPSYMNVYQNEVFLASATPSKHTNEKDDVKIYSDYVNKDDVYEMVKSLQPEQNEEENPYCSIPAYPAPLPPRKTK